MVYESKTMEYESYESQDHRTTSPQQHIKPTRIKYKM